jgi:hypothetical protein
MFVGALGMVSDQSTKLEGLVPGPRVGGFGEVLCYSCLLLLGTMRVLVGG